MQSLSAVQRVLDARLASGPRMSMLLSGLRRGIRAFLSWLEGVFYHGEMGVLLKQVSKKSEDILEDVYSWHVSDLGRNFFPPGVQRYPVTLADSQGNLRCRVQLGYYSYFAANLVQI
jgi:hypothetical protein